jgi:hypothetical protein
MGNKRKGKEDYAIDTYLAIYYYYYHLHIIEGFQLPTYLKILMITGLKLSSTIPHVD